MLFTGSFCLFYKKTMKASDELLRKAEADLSLNALFVKGENAAVRDCWHLSTDGNAVDSMFYDEMDFIDGMNRIQIVSSQFDVIILAFVLMDTHVHFIIYGKYDESNHFIHEYLRRTSMYLEKRYCQTKKLKNVPVSCQRITDDRYLKTAICYVIKNPTAAGLQYTPYEYPWSSGALYFRNRGGWTSPAWTNETYFNGNVLTMSLKKREARFKTRSRNVTGAISSDGLIFPGNYVCFELVEKLFRTCRSFMYFLNSSREEDMNPLEKTAMRLSVPIWEMRLFRNEACLELFGESSIRNLDMVQRMHLARTLRSRHRCSVKQVCRVCGLVYGEVKDSL